jgi:hypothetical protein
MSFIHLGDIHYPESKDSFAGLDIKDKGMAEGILHRVAPHPLKNVMKEVRRILEAKKITGILLSGDLTTHAKMDDYRACIEYLRGCLTGIDLWSVDGLHVVPGNHDVDRSKVPPPSETDDETSPLAMAKFDSIKQAWVDVGLPILAVEDVRIHPVTEESCQVLVFSVNSCLGCGEYRRYPAPIRMALATLLSAEEKESGISRDSIAEQLDSPAFDDAHLAEIVEQMAELGPLVPAIVLGHHAILPQATPRIALYTEVMNGGVARYRLTECPSPIVYCHGHIHESPVEVVSHPDKQSRPLILVSAPQLSAGFNLINFYFTDAGMVLGCEVIRYTSQTFGGVQASSPIRQALFDPSEPEYASDEVSAAIGTALTREYVRFSHVEAHVRKILPGASQDEIAERLREMEWFERIEILARESEPKHWHLRRKVA